MALNFNFVKVQKHRVFNYQPRYYDERKERMEERYAQKDREKGILREDKYVPGRHIRGKIRSAVYDNRRHAMNRSISRIIGIVSLLALMIGLYILAQNFSYLFT